MAESPCFWTLEQQAEALERRELSSRELVSAYLSRIEAVNPALNAFVLVMGGQAMGLAFERDQERASGEEQPRLHGIPIAIKDLFDFKAGVRNTFGSVPLKDFVPSESSTYVQRLEEAGAIVLGKTNTPEFGHKGITDSPLLGPCSTPFKVGFNAGGSSGGSASAVAAGLCSGAQGSDGGGSIRIPASWCGAYGFKATFGVVANVARPNGFNSHTPFIHAGPITRSVGDAAVMLDAMAGLTGRDPFSVPSPSGSFREALKNTRSGIRIAVDPTLGGFPVESSVLTVVESLVHDLERADLEVETRAIDFGVSHTELTALWLRQAGWINAKSVFSLRRTTGIDLFDRKVAESLTPEFREMIDRATRFDLEAVVHDEELRTIVLTEMESLFDRYDFILSATLGHPPIKNTGDGSTVGPSVVAGEAVDSLIGWCLTHPINMTGHPAASLPAGLDADGFPVGLQIVGRKFDDVGVLQVSKAIEMIRPWAGTYDLVRERVG